MKNGDSFIDTARTFSKKVTAVTGMTGKAVYRKNSVTAVTSVTRKSKTCYIITAPTFSNFTIKYRCSIHSIRRDRRFIAGLFLCEKTNRRNEKWKSILTQVDPLREPSEVYIRRRCRSKHRVWMYTSQTPCQGIPLKPHQNRKKEMRKQNETRKTNQFLARRERSRQT